MPTTTDASVFAGLLPSFLRVRAEFEQEIQARREGGLLSFERIDQMETRLYHLKNETHRLHSRNRLSGSRAVKPDVLFDLLVGSIFHEMLHLKEYLYSITSYGPEYETLFKSREGSQKGTIDSELAALLRRILDAARVELPRKTKEVQGLFQSATLQMERILRESPEDVRLPRLLYSSEPDLDEIYGPRGLAEVFSRIYPGGAAEGFSRVGSSFLAAGFVVEGVAAFRRGLECFADVKGDSEDVRRLVLPIREHLEEIQTRWPETTGIPEALAEWSKLAMPLLQGPAPAKPAKEAADKAATTGHRRKS
ncbi:MAG: hypothetical protein AAB215_04565 [Planctomycetota bacterium]